MKVKPKSMKTSDSHSNSTENPDIISSQGSNQGSVKAINYHNHCVMYSHHGQADQKQQLWKEASKTCALNGTDIAFSMSQLSLQNEELVTSEIRRNYLRINSYLDNNNSDIHTYKTATNGNLANGVTFKENVEDENQNSDILSRKPMKSSQFKGNRNAPYKPEVQQVPGKNLSSIMNIPLDDDDIETESRNLTDGDDLDIEQLNATFLEVLPSPVIKEMIDDMSPLSPSNFDNDASLAPGCSTNNNTQNPEIEPQNRLPHDLDSLPCRKMLQERLEQHPRRNEAFVKVSLVKDEELTAQDDDGDTYLIRLVSQHHHQNDFLLLLLFFLIERIRCKPGTISHKNRRRQTALFAASILHPTEPLIACYIAETLLSLDEDIIGDIYYKNKTLIECLTCLGKSHDNVRKQLLHLIQDFYNRRR